MGNLEIILTKMKDQDVLIAMHTDTWQRNAKSQRKIKRQGDIISMTK